MERFQYGHGFKRSRLYSSPATFRAVLWKRIRQEVGSGVPVDWRRVGAEKWRTSANAYAAARQIVKAARELKPAAVFEVRHTATDEQKRLRIHKHVADPPAITNIPKVALLTRPTRRTLRYHAEIEVAIIGVRNLGIYVPRPLRDDTPPGWTVGDPWPDDAYASEHAWAAAKDCGVDNATGTGYATEPARIAPVLEKVTNYTLANFARLRVVDHIHDHVRWRRRPNGTPMLERYGGSDPHETHTHTAFADHGGAKPPWL